VEALRSGLAQALVALDRSPTGRASRSERLGPLGSPSPGSPPVSSDPYGLGVVLSGALGFALWRLRARTVQPPTV